MPFVTRFTIQRLDEYCRTEYYTGDDQWSSDENDSEEFRTAAKANRRADRVCGTVCQYERMATDFEAYIAEIRMRHSHELER